MPFGINLGFGSDYADIRSQRQSQQPQQTGANDPITQGFLGNPDALGLDPNTLAYIQGIEDPNVRNSLLASIASNQRASQAAVAQANRGIQSLQGAQQRFETDPQQQYVGSELGRRSAPNYESITRQQLQPAYSAIAAGVASSERAMGQRLAQQGVSGPYAAGLQGQSRIPGGVASANLEAQRAQQNEAARYQALRDLAQFSGGRQQLGAQYASQIAGGIAGVPTQPSYDFSAVGSNIQAQDLFQDYLRRQEDLASPSLFDYLLQFGGNALPAFLPGGGIYGG